MFKGFSLAIRSRQGVGQQLAAGLAEPDKRGNVAFCN